ncbi:MAG: hypothetical protein ACRD3N_16100 [Terracidiphilus sp.]
MKADLKADRRPKAIGPQRTASKPVSFANEEEFLDAAMKQLESMNPKEFKTACEKLEKIGARARASD